MKAVAANDCNGDSRMLCCRNERTAAMAIMGKPCFLLGCAVVKQMGQTLS